MHESNHEAVKAEQSQLDEKEHEMRELVANAESKRAWMSDFYEWMETVATFLDEKVWEFILPFPMVYTELIFILCRSSPSSRNTKKSIYRY